MTDLIERLRDHHQIDGDFGIHSLREEAADEIERLTAERNEAVKAGANEVSCRIELQGSLDVRDKEIERLTKELRGAKAKITILSDLLTDKCDELKELANKQETDDE